MFLTVMPGGHKASRDVLEDMFSHLEEDYINLPDEDDDENSIYIIAKQPDIGIIGSARIVERSLSDLPEEVFFSETVDTSVPFSSFWECNRIYFSIESYSKIHEDPAQFEKICRAFYQGLYETLRSLSLSKNLDFMFVESDPEEHEDIRFFGHWPFKHELQIAEDANGQEAILATLSFTPGAYAQFKSKCAEDNTRS